VKVAWILLAIPIAVAAQTTVNRWFPGGVVDLPLVAVVSCAVIWGRVTGMLAGSLAGVLQDAMSGGIIGMAGLSKTVVGFLAGIASTQFIVAHALSRFVVFFLSTVIDGALFMGLYEWLGLRHFGSPVTTVALQGVTNAVVGVLAFKLAETIPEVVERGRASGSGRRR